MPSTIITDKLSHWIDEHFDELVAFLQKMVQIPTDMPPGNNAPHAQAVVEALSAWGLNAAAHPVPDDMVKSYGMTSITNLIVRRPYGENGPIVAMNAHGDVVPPGEGWTRPPYGGVVENGRLYGRAAAVSKSDFATYIFAVRALEALGMPLKGCAELHLTYDEEFGGLFGPKWLLDQGLTNPDYVISAGFSYSVVTAHNGCLQFEIEVLGKATHGSMPETGHDALAAATKILQAIYERIPLLSSMRSSIPGINHPTMIVGRIDGGTNTNVVPGQVILKVDRRLIPEEDPAVVEADVRAFIEAAVSGLEGITINIKRILFANALRPLPGHAKLANLIQKNAQEIFCVEIPLTGSPLYTDARLYSEYGIPVVLYGAGPRTIPESKAKQADENIELEVLRKATKVVAMTLSDFLLL
ncbi:MAG TPA: ArgE/DapE family deacylase [Advenella sp.]|nr:ArgE/DapE family deacylase [Advenella sp.]